MPKVWGYIRVSTRDQADSGLSLDAQHATIEARYAGEYKRQGFEFGGIFEDQAVSAKKRLFNRRSGFRLSQAVNRGDVVIFTKLDRGFRNTIDALTVCQTWRDMGVRVVFLDLGVDMGTSVGILVLSLMAAISQFERERIGERCADAVLECRRRGYKIGRPPVTLRIVGKKEKARWEIVPEEYRVGQAIVSWKAQRFTWGDIMKHLNDKGIARPAPRRKVASHYLAGFRGERWTENAVRRYYHSTLKTMLMVNEGKVKEPPALSA